MYKLWANWRQNERNEEGGLWEGMGEQARKRGEGVQIYQARQLLICIFSFSSYLGQVKPSTFIQALDTNCYRRCTTFDCNRRIAYILCQSFSSSKPGHKCHSAHVFALSNGLFWIIQTHNHASAYHLFPGILRAHIQILERRLFVLCCGFVCLFVWLVQQGVGKVQNTLSNEPHTKKKQQQQLGSPLLSNHSLGSKRCLR